MKKEKQFSKTIVVFSLITVLVFTGIILFFYWNMRQVPDSVIYSFYALFGVELASLAGIKKKEEEIKKYQNSGGSKNERSMG